MAYCSTCHVTLKVSNYNHASTIREYSHLSRLLLRQPSAKISKCPNVTRQCAQFAVHATRMRALTYARTHNSLIRAHLFVCLRNKTPLFLPFRCCLSPSTLVHLLPSSTLFLVTDSDFSPSFYLKQFCATPLPPLFMPYLPRSCKTRYNIP